jgi:hypothetical protein
MTFRHPLAFPLGLLGVALLRADAGDPSGPVEDRIAEVRALLAAHDAGELGAGVTIGATDTKTGYRIWSESYDTFNPLIAVEEPLVRELLDALPAGRALDAACGTGRHAAHLVSRGHRVTGVDSSPDMLAVARDKVPDAEFDLVVCALALPHVPDVAPVLAEFHRVLRPGGHLILSDVHWMSLYLGGIAWVTDADGLPKRMTATRLRPADYLAAALPLGFEVKGLQEPRWPVTMAGGGPVADAYAPEAVRSAYSGVPAAIIWHLRKP